MAWIALALVAVLGAACGSTAPSPSPIAVATTPAPTPTPTPDPHLKPPVSAETIYTALNAAGLKITADSASAGKPGTEPVSKILASYEQWPLIISEYSSTSALDKATRWKAGEKPGQGEPPVAIKGMNLLFEWGPQTGAAPPTPDSRQREAVDALVAALDPLLYPLAARTTVGTDVPSHEPSPAPTASPGPTSEPTPKPSKKPGKKKPKPKPTKKPGKKKPKPTKKPGDTAFVLDLGVASPHA